MHNSIYAVMRKKFRGSANYESPCIYSNYIKGRSNDSMKYANLHCHWASIGHVREGRLGLRRPITISVLVKRNHVVKATDC